MVVHNGISGQCGNSGIGVILKLDMESDNAYNSGVAFKMKMKTAPEPVRIYVVCENEKGKI